MKNRRFGIGLQRLCGLFMTAALGAGMLMMPAMEASAAPVTVCIDPGHGGTNQGAMYNGLLEKNCTLAIAGAMATELSKYEGVNVVMTRTSDVDVSLPDRAAIAAANGADFLFSIHLNASNEHKLFGSEVWISGSGEQYAKGMTFGTLALQQLSTDVGVYAKGVKTKLKSDGSDFYGVINGAAKSGVAAAIIEHCYMDESHDTAYYMTSEAMTALGKADATAVAKYYGLKSTVLGVDYSGYKKKTFKSAKTPVSQDLTAPEVSQIALTGYDAATGQVRLHVKASDTQSKIIFYNYSADGGQTWSNLWGWTANGEGDISFTMPANSNGNVCIKVWNQYDLETVSNIVTVK